MPKTHFVGPGDSLEMGACSNGSRSGERGGPRVEGRRRLQMKSARVSSEGRRMAVRSSWFWKPPRVGSEVEVIRRFYFLKVFGARLCIDEPVLLVRHSRALFEALRAFGRGERHSSWWYFPVESPEPEGPSPRPISATPVRAPT